MNAAMNTETLFNGYEHFANGEYAEEAKQRWGDTEPLQTTKRRTAGYTKDDWARIEAEANAITPEFLVAMQQRLSADSPEARSLAERHRLHIDRWFYACSHAMHVQVASLYTADPRFQAHYDAHSPGLAMYIESAIRANVEAQNSV
jgi:MerR family transcriptional regulator, thiopeptide resistance regulator